MDFYRTQPTLHRGDIPVDLRLPEQMNRYRATNQPWMYYLKRLFQIHNETVHIWWTNVIGLVTLLIDSIEENTEDSDIWTEKYSCPVYVCFLFYVVFCMCMFWEFLST